MIFLNPVTKGLIKIISLELMRSADVFTNTNTYVIIRIIMLLLYLKNNRYRRESISQASAT